MDENGDPRTSNTEVMQYCWGVYRAMIRKSVLYLFFSLLIVMEVGIGFDMMVAITPIGVTTEFGNTEMFFRMEASLSLTC